MTPEKKVENYFIKVCEEHDILHYKFLPSTAGLPDRVLIGHGKTAFCELKRPGQKPRPLQEHIIKKMREHGAIVYTADTKEAVNEVIKDFICN